MPPVHILFVDDDAELRDIIPRLLQHEPWIVRTASDGLETLECLRREAFDIAILDFVMPHLNGIEVLKAVRDESMGIDAIILTGYGSVNMAVEAMKLGAREFLQKPVDGLLLIKAIRRVLESRETLFDTLEKRFDTFLREHLSESSLRLEHLSNHYRLSQGYISRIFRSHIGVSFRKRLNYFRILKAKSLLETTKAPLSLIAEQCGFKNQKRFSEEFHRQYGVGPRRYREVCSGK